MSGPGSLAALNTMLNDMGIRGDDEVDITTPVISAPETTPTTRSDGASTNSERILSSRASTNTPSRTPVTSVTPGSFTPSAEHRMSVASPTAFRENTNPYSQGKNRHGKRERR